MSALSASAQVRADATRRSRTDRRRAPTPGAGHDTDPAAPDLRLVPAAGGAWLAAWLVLTVGAVSLVVPVAVLGATAVAVVLAQRRSRAVHVHPLVAPDRAVADPQRGSLPAAVVLLLVGVLTVGGVAAARVSTLHPAPVEDLVARRGTATVQLEVASDPLGLGRAPVPAFGPGRVLVRAHLVRVEVDDAAHALRVPVVVFAGASWSDLLPGHRVIAEVRFAAPGRRTEAATLSARAPPVVLAGPGRLQRAAASLRAGLHGLVAERSPDVRGLVPGMVLGDTAAVPAALHDDERTTGLTHLTAVSGANVAVLLGSALLAVRVVGVPRRLRPACGLLVVAGFVVLARPEPSVLRATVMGAVMLLAVSRGHRTRGPAALSAAVLVLLAGDPWLALMPGFALSVLATAALLLVAPRWADALARRLPVPVAVALAVAAAAHVATVPVIVTLSGEVSLVALLANVLAEPAVLPVTLAGTLATVLEPVVPVVAGGCATVAAAGAWWVAQVAHRCAALPAAAVPWPDGGWPLAALALLCVAVLVARPRRRGHRTRRPARPGCDGPDGSSGVAGGAGVTGGVRG